jgi:hypothetical protein
VYSLIYVSFGFVIGEEAKLKNCVGHEVKLFSS